MQRIHEIREDSAIGDPAAVAPRVVPCSSRKTGPESVVGGTKPKARADAEKAQADAQRAQADAKRERAARDAIERELLALKAQLGKTQ